MAINISEEYLDSILDIIEENENLIIYDYKDKEDQILFSKDLVDKFHHIIDDITKDKDKENAKEILKFIIRETLELCSSDLIVSKNGNYFIKLLDDERNKPISEERRYDGINEEDLKSFYDEFLSDKDNIVIFPKAAKEFVSIFLNEKKITNEQYEQNVFKEIQSIIHQYLISQYDNSDGFFHGFSGYIFRIHFNTVFEYIADLILKEISRSNPFMIEFMNYYSVHVLVLNGKKYKVPSIETSDGLRWNTTSIHLIAKKYFETNEAKKTLLNEINQLKKETTALHIGGVSPLQYQANITKKIQEFNLNLKIHSNELDSHLNSLTTVKIDDEKKRLVAKTAELKNLIQNLGKQKKEMSTKLLEDSRLKKYNEHKKNLESKVKQLKNEEIIFNKNKNLYLPMRNSFKKALTSKKKLM